MAKQIQMTKGDDVIKCSEDHIQHLNPWDIKQKKIVPRKHKKC